MTRNLGGWAERGGVVRQVEEVPKNPCKSSTGAALNHSTVKGPERPQRFVITLQDAGVTGVII